MAKAKQAKTANTKAGNNGASATATAGEEGFDDARRDNYRVKLEVFEGPLDLLLYLIKKDELNIQDIPVAHITEQYLAYLALMQELDIAVAGDFLVLASTLIYIKSKMLLPPDPRADGEPDLHEDPRAELVERLLEYQKFKAAANLLYSRGELEAACYPRGKLETDTSNPEVAATMFDLLRVFQEILKRAESEAQLEIHRDEITMAEKVAQIRAALADGAEINVRELFALARTKRELIVIFLAFLEMVKYAEVSLLQREIYGEIFARKRMPASDAAPVSDEVYAQAEAEMDAPRALPQANAETNAQPELQMDNMQMDAAENIERIEPKEAETANEEQ